MLEKLRHDLNAWQAKALVYYKRYERFFPVIFFLLGFIWDSMTLSIENTADHYILLSYIVLAGVLITVIGFIETGQISDERVLHYKEWYPNILQFLLGGLFSAYVIFYFKSAAMSKSLIFVALLMILLVLNEFLHHRLTNITLLCSLYFFSTFAFLTFFLPVITHKMTSAMFFSSGVIGFLITSAIVTLIYRNIFRQEPRRILRISTPILIVFGMMSFFYLSNWIPPVPLAMKYGGIFHHVHKDKSSNSYDLRYFRRYPFQFWVTSDKTYRWAQGDTVFCFASIYAPIEWREKIYYRWQFYDDRQGKYITSDRLGYQISGGRRDGYRGYTYKRNLQPGDWRVDIETSLGQILGRIDFEIIAHEGGEKGQEMRLVK